MIFEGEMEKFNDNMVTVEPEVINLIIRHNMANLYEPIYDPQKIFKIPLNKDILHYLKTSDEYPKIKLMSEICINPLEVYVIKYNPDLDYIDALDVKPVDRRLIFEGEKYRFP